MKIPRPEQLEAVERMAAEPTHAALQGSDLGSGKSGMTCLLIDRLNPNGTGVNLVLGPPNVLDTREGWIDEFRDWIGQDIKLIRRTKKGQQFFEDMLSGVPGNYLMSRSLVNSQWVIDGFKRKHKLSFVAIDECAFMSNRKSRTFANMKLIQAEYKLAISATPYGNRFDGAWTIARWLWGEKGAPRSFWMWAGQWAETKYNPFSGYNEVVREKNPGAFFSSLPCYINMEGSYKEKPKSFPIPYKLSAQERAQYEQFKELLVAEAASGGAIVAELPNQKKMRLKQMSLGMVSVERHTETVQNEFGGFEEKEKQTVYWEDDCKSSALARLKELLDDNPGKKFLIGTASKKFSEVAAKRLGSRAAAWNGDKNSTQRADLKNRFIEGDLDYLVCQIKSAAEGINGFQNVCNNMIFLDILEGEPTQQKQFIGRLARNGQTKRVNVGYLVAEDSYDEEILVNEINQRVAIAQELLKENNG